VGIWRVLTAKVYCDICNTLIATLEFDANDSVNIERIHVYCTACKPVEETE
jgi:hypothetical protein